MSALRVGLVGCGRVAADLHLPALARVDGVEAVAVADVDQARARAVADRFGVARVHAEAAALAADEAVDLVAVCVPPRQHGAVALTALRAGRHLFVEKPLTLSPAEADALVAEAAALPLVAAAGFNLRTHRQVVAARKLLDGGRLGRLRMIRTHWTAAARPPGWRARAGEGGGALWEMGVHHLDLWRHLGGGEPQAVAATGDDERVVLTAQIPAGPVLATTLATGTSDGHEVELVGDRGRLVLLPFRADGPRWHPLGRAAGGVGVRLAEALRTAATLPAQVRAARAGGDYHASFEAEWRAVLAAVRGGGRPHASLEDGRRVVALAAAAQASLASGAPAEVAP